MKLKKPKFWNKGKSSILPYILLPLSILLQILNSVNKLIGNSKKSQNKLKWRPKITFDKLIHDMIKYEKKTNLYN